MEKTIAELQESILKRNPDSVASLIRAAKTSDSVQLERKKEKDDIEQLKQELVDAKEGYERRLRGLRQEHEKVKTQYETKINELSLKSAVPSSASAPSVDTKNIKTLGQAQVRIKELEDQIEKLRTFYTNKVEDIKSKSENQMRALKRGGAQESQALDEDEYDLHKLQQEYEMRLAALEQELVSTAEDLSKSRKEYKVVKDELESLKSVAPPVTPATEQAVATIMPIYYSQMPPPPPPSVVNNDVNMEREVEVRVAARLRDMDTATYSEKDKLHQQLQQFNSDKELLLQRLHEEELRCQALMNEINTLKFNNNKPTSPQMAQFLAMETQLSTLESRLQRREKELMSVIDEGKIASKMELTRMQSLYNQELKDKDDQLVRFQNELELLVSQIRLWQNGQSTNNPNVNITKTLYV